MLKDIFMALPFALQEKILTGVAIAIIAFILLIFFARLFFRGRLGALFLAIIFVSLPILLSIGIAEAHNARIAFESGYEESYSQIEAGLEKE